MAHRAGNLKGTVYYNSYGTSLVTNSGPKNDFDGMPFGAAMLAIQPGATAPVVVAGSNGEHRADAGCRVCHTVSANGQELIAQEGNSYATSNCTSCRPYRVGCRRFGERVARAGA